MLEHRLQPETIALVNWLRDQALIHVAGTRCIQDLNVLALVGLVAGCHFVLALAVLLRGPGLDPCVFHLFIVAHQLLMNVFRRAGSLVNVGQDFVSLLELLYLAVEQLLASLALALLHTRFLLIHLPVLLF